ncbi:MAG: hypothetical protein KJ063_01065 [Anaerolineae bacterium]|nr:hypothetical protein [Anaerolineae bacterium]
MPNQKMPDYIAYLVRLWREDDKTWRGTLEDPHTGQRYVFAEVEALLAHIREQTRPQPIPPQPD